MRLRTLFVVVVLPLLLVVGGVILFTPADILGPVASSTATASAAPLAEGETTERVAIVAEDTLQVVPAAVEEIDSSATANDTRWITARSLNMRAGPTTSDELVTALPFGTQVAVLEVQGTWAHVSAPTGETGWMSVNFLSETDPASSVQ